MSLTDSPLRRAAAVEEEMTEMARENAREIAALKLKLAEKDAQLMGGFGPAANLPLGNLGGNLGHISPAGGRGPTPPVSANGRRMLDPIANMDPYANAAMLGMQMEAH